MSVPDMALRARGEIRLCTRQLVLSPPQTPHISYTCGTPGVSAAKPPEIKCRKPSSWHKVYRDCEFLCWGFALMLPCR
eukprot:3933164-Rhodomonas_salina.1